MNLLHQSHLHLVLLAYVVSTASAYTSMSLTERLQLTRQKFWLIMAGSSLGIGLWSMHFIAMLAYRLPSYESYSIYISLSSLAISVFSTVLALGLIGSEKLTGKKVFFGSLILGTGACAMHFVGVLALHPHFYIHFDPLSIILTEIIGLADALLVFALTYYWRKISHKLIVRACSALLMGGGMITLHYTGMAGTTIVPILPSMSSQYDVSEQWLGVGIAFVTLFIFSLAVTSIYINRRMVASEKRYQSLFEENLDMIGLIDLEGRILHVNREFRNLLGYRDEELVQEKLGIFLDEPPERVEQLAAQMMIGNPLETELTFRHRLGHRVDVLLKTIPMMIDHELRGIYVVGKDMTESKQVRNALVQLSREHEEEKLRVEQEQRNQELKFQSVIDTALDGIVVMDSQMKILVWNKGAEHIFGYCQEEAIGKSMEVIIAKKYWQKCEAVVNRYLLSGNASLRGEMIELEGRRKDGTQLPLEISLSMWRADEQTLFSAFIRDVAELRKAREILEQSEKLTAVGQLAAGIAHEIRNPLTAIKGFLQLMKADLNENYYEIMFSELSRIELIIGELLMVSKPQKTAYLPNDLIVIVNHVIALLSSQANMQNVTITPVFEAEQAWIRCDQNQIKQVLVNMIKNAIEAMPKGGDISIKVKTDNEVRLEISDQGQGIPEEKLVRLGQPFYTTKEKGTGLGLLVSFNIIRNHQGKVKVKSKLNVGTTFSISFPLIEPSADQRADS
ncbi:PAS domain S-box protein [Brevibacillus fulvus]|uniref:histidine kinase n=1 Tax=Brevibacillus fulvus TaxID=1125967 RepID=A0A939BSG4_9BACL|nr:PAS domain S-box protein [Brevibacillus fulvus]MBM7590687.1 PAS domain S-box-containing protein [Brevibacillus fulvus]